MVEGAFAAGLSVGDLALGHWGGSVVEGRRARADDSASSGGTAAPNKRSSQNREAPEQIDAAIRQLVSKAITTEGQVIDVFTVAKTLIQG
ncbi:MAG: hypothetical protein ACKV19_06145 [Verrucomicrobiales bacterium]